MMRAAAFAIALSGATLCATTAYAGESETKQGEMRITTDDFARTIRWLDQEDEVAYHISGELRYVESLDCPFDPQATGETVSFDEELPADTISFQWPAPEGGQIDTLKDIEITIQAVGENGEVLITDGIGKQQDPFCEEPPVVGHGPGAGAAAWPRLWAVAALAGAGALLSAGGAALLRRRA